MKVALTYIFANLELHKYGPLALRFVQSYVANPPGSTPHEVTVISNGYPIQENQKPMFGALNPRYFNHNNVGKDLGGFVAFAERFPSDLMICFGSHIQFTRPGWLDRIVKVFLDNGPGMYAPWGFYQPNPHLRTTAFWMPSELLTGYPYAIGNPQRYEAEHGHNSIVGWVKKMGFPAIQVTWSKVLQQDQWEHVSREDTLLLDQHCERNGWKA